MVQLFSPDYAWLWALVLGVALFVPVRQLIWVLSVRRQQAKTGALPDDASRRHLRRRAGVTAGLLCFLFAIVYTSVLFGDRP